MALSLYSKRLAEENPDDVCKALESLQEIPPHQSGRSMPDMGTILAAVDTQRRMRIVRMSNQDEERLVRWQCPLCKVTMSGFVKFGQSRVRHCRGIPKKQYYGPGEVCGGTMEVIEDLPARAASGR